MISAPVYSDENGTPHISIYVEDDDGTFRRTQVELLRLLRDDIKGISISQGQMVSSQYDRYERDWSTPTVTFHYGRPQSYYQFLREKVARNRFFVFTKPQLSGHITKFSVHELQLKNSSSQRKLAILKEKYIEALDLWSEEQHAKIDKQKRSHTHTPERPQEPQVKEPSGSSEYIDLHADALSIEMRDSPLEDMRRQHPALTEKQQRKNLIQDFKLKKSKRKSVAKEEPQNRHFYKRFIFTIE